MRTNVITVNVLNAHATIPVPARTREVDIRVGPLPAGRHRLVAEPPSAPVTFQRATLGGDVLRDGGPGTFLDMNQMEVRPTGENGQFLLFESVLNPTEKDWTIRLEFFPVR